MYPCQKMSTYILKLLWEIVKNAQNKVAQLLTLVWVPGRCAILGNESAEKVGCNGSTTNFMGPQRCTVKSFLRALSESF